MQGHVTGSQPTLKVPFLIPNISVFELEFVVDTGFEGDLTLPLAVAEALNLEFDQPMVANLADNVNRSVDAFHAKSRWFGEERRVIVLGLGRRPLLGTRLLDSNDLAIEFIHNGSVKITQHTGT